MTVNIWAYFIIPNFKQRKTDISSWDFSMLRDTSQLYKLYCPLRSKTLNVLARDKTQSDGSTFSRKENKKWFWCLANLGAGEGERIVDNNIHTVLLLFYWQVTWLLTTTSPCTGKGKNSLLRMFMLQSLPAFLGSFHLLNQTMLLSIKVQ